MTKLKQLQQWKEKKDNEICYQDQCIFPAYHYVLFWYPHICGIYYNAKYLCPESTGIQNNNCLTDLYCFLYTIGCADQTNFNSSCSEYEGQLSIQ